MFDTCERKRDTEQNRLLYPCLHFTGEDSSLKFFLTFQEDPR